MRDTLIHNRLTTSLRTTCLLPKNRKYHHYYYAYQYTHFQQGREMICLNHVVHLLIVFCFANPSRTHLIDRESFLCVPIVQGLVIRCLFDAQMHAVPLMPAHCGYVESRQLAEVVYMDKSFSILRMQTVMTWSSSSLMRLSPS